MENRNNHIKRMMFVALFAALTAAVSPIKIPLGFTPVPITLQTLMVLLSGALLGSNLGALSQLIYILVGAIGLPVFSGGSSGIGVILGPTGGFLLSFPIAAYITGFMAENGRLNRLLNYITGMFVGTIMIYLLGSIQGKLYTGLSFTAILAGWILPFLIGDFVKLALAVYIAMNFNLKRYLK